MILPPVVVDVLTHASSENVCGPDCQYGEITPCTVPVLVVPGKFVAVSALAEQRAGDVAAGVRTR